MKSVIIYISVALTLLSGANDFTVILSCDKLPEYTAICADKEAPSEVVEPAPTYLLKDQYIKWGYGDENGTAYIGEVEVRYENPEIPVFKTNTDNGMFTAEIEPNESFFVYSYDNNIKRWSTHGEKFILRIGSTTGNMLWKKWKPSTSRWIKLDLDSDIIMSPDLVVHHVGVSDIHKNGATITWEGEAEADVWLQVKGTTSDPWIHPATNHEYIFSQLGAGYTFTLSVRGSDGYVITTEFSTPSN